MLKLNELKRPLGAALLFAAALAAVFAAGCASPGPSVIDVPDYSPDEGRKISAELPEPEIELPELPAPGPETAAFERKTEVRYRITPEEGYSTESAYLRVSFVPAVPPEAGESPARGGRISVHIGHRDIEGANTKWYSYSIIVDGRKYNKKGKVSVPFVRGRDNYWWNEEVLRLPKPLEDEVTVTVTDEYGGTVRRVTVTKEGLER